MCYQPKRTSTTMYYRTDRTQYAFQHKYIYSSLFTAYGTFQCILRIFLILHYQSQQAVESYASFSYLILNRLRQQDINSVFSIPSYNQHRGHDIAVSTKVTSSAATTQGVPELNTNPKHSGHMEMQKLFFFISAYMHVKSKYLGNEQHDNKKTPPCL